MAFLKAPVTNKINLYLRKTFFSKFLLYLDLEVVKAALAVSCCLGTLYTEVFDHVENPGPVKTLSRPGEIKSSSCQVVLSRDPILIGFVLLELWTFVALQ